MCGGGGGGFTKIINRKNVLSFKNNKQLISLILELKNNKQNYCDLFLADFDNLENKCEFYSEQLLLTGKIMETNESRVEKIKKITIDDVLSVSKCLFTKENIKIACYGTSDHKKILKKIIL